MSKQKHTWTKRGVIGAVGVGIIGVSGTLATGRGSTEWLFSSSSATQSELPIEIVSVVTDPPGRAIKSFEILIENTSSDKDLTVDVLVEIESEDEPDDGWPLIEEVEIEASSQIVLTESFDETYGSVEDGDLLVSIEQSSLESE